MGQAFDADNDEGGVGTDLVPLGEGFLVVTKVAAGWSPRSRDPPDQYLTDDQRSRT